MGSYLNKFKHTVATTVALVMFSLPLEADQADLLAQLREAGPEEAQKIARDLRREWAKSGSAAMDLLLKRGRDALEVQDFAEAVEHFTALTDHAPDFAEGWYGLAQAYFQQEKVGPALDGLERVLAINPNHFGAIQGLGAIFEMLDDPDKAYAAYEQVLAIHPHDAEVIEAMERLEQRVLGTQL